MFEVNGMGLADSEKVSRSEIDPDDDGESSNDGVRFCVMPARVKLTDCTAAAGA